jgi:SAM-dependent methyltransferase
MGNAAVKLPQFNHEQREFVRLLSNIDRGVRILDVGCGTGRNLDLLRSLGFARLVGVDRNPDLVAGVVQRGFTCLTPEQLETENTQPFDLILMSHIIEHFHHDELLNFMESYLGRLRIGGHLVIVTPLFSSVFYNDFDHVRPYLPMGISMVFGEELAQVQYRSRIVLRLTDLRFYRGPLRLQFFRALYMNTENVLPLWTNRVLRLLFSVSGGIVGQRMGWMGLYEYAGDRDKA